jgi:hypothetical protein
MEICTDKRHEECAYDERRHECPACLALDELERANHKVDELKQEIADHECEA